MNEQDERLGHLLTARKIIVAEDESKSLNREGSSTQLPTENHLKENFYEGFDKYWAVVGHNFPHRRQFRAGVGYFFSATSTVVADCSTLGRVEAKQKSNTSKLRVAVEFIRSSGINC